MTENHKKVKGPDGRIFAFPADMSFERINGIMGETYGKAKAPAGDLTRFGVPEGATDDQARAILSQNIQDGEAQSKRSGLKIKGLKAITRPLNAVARFANGATLGVPDRALAALDPTKTYEDIKDANARLEGYYPVSSNVAEIEGIDTPETRRAQCRSERKLGYEAKGYARGLMEGKRVRVRHKGEVDRYKRLLLAHIEIDGHDYSQIMLEKGYAVRWTKLWRATPKHKRWCDGKAL